MEYKGKAENPEKTIEELNNQLKNIIAEKLETVTKLYSYNEAVNLKIIP